MCKELSVYVSLVIFVHCDIQEVDFYVIFCIDRIKTSLSLVSVGKFVCLISFFKSHQQSWVEPVLS